MGGGGTNKSDFQAGLWPTNDWSTNGIAAGYSNAVSQFAPIIGSASNLNEQLAAMDLTWADMGQYFRISNAVFAPLGYIDLNPMSSDLVAELLTWLRVAVLWAVTFVFVDRCWKSTWQSLGLLMSVSLTTAGYASWLGYLFAFFVGELIVGVVYVFVESGSVSVVAGIADAIANQPFSWPGVIARGCWLADQMIPLSQVITLAISWLIYDVVIKLTGASIAAGVRSIPG